ncbi:peptidase C1A family protein [Cavenderia fasciculata]|uniref:Peptidase C1A family protein n=1 Tax=Cavenderia fasciculata TaxID=261658 RepID=F4QAK5_CACFS|nr:peptidase C1A family protein [Cavenderia fasciculata]EGG15724.1 peptidase C1A family protein [Cavenderia fasciculata]|eukprot:XP_004354466.1 peptidase C1A family protein [Cavenderia fasciculata]
MKKHFSPAQNVCPRLYTANIYKHINKREMRIILFIALFIAFAAAHESCVQRVENKQDYTRVKTPQPHQYLSPEDVPAAWDWRSATLEDGITRNYLGATRNQHLPQYCGSCWAMSVTSQVSSRLKIGRLGSFPEVDLAAQVLLNCMGNYNFSCANGGDPTIALEYIATQGITDETCAPYEAIDLECTAENVCKNCNFDLSNPTAKCFAQPTYTTYYVEEHGLVNGTDNMKAEIFARGPISCGMCVTDAFEAYQGGIFSDNTGNGEINHEILIVGWGSEGGVDYWIGLNSWGSFWGELATFRILMGSNILNIESDCDWAVPRQ